MVYMMIQDRSAQNWCAAFTTACTACRFRLGCAQQPRFITTPKRSHALRATREVNSRNRDEVSVLAWVYVLLMSTQHVGKC
jgi:hypothetical protein